VTAFVNRIFTEVVLEKLILEKLMWALWLEKSTCHTKLAVWKVIFILLSVYCVFFVVAVYFITDYISSCWILTSYNDWVHYRISNIGKGKDGFNCGDL